MLRSPPAGFIQGVDLDAVATALAPRLIAYATARTGSREAGEDVAQEAPIARRCSFARLGNCRSRRSRRSRGRRQQRSRCVSRGHAAGWRPDFRSTRMDDEHTLLEVDSRVRAALQADVDVCRRVAASAL